MLPKIGYRYHGNKASGFLAIWPVNGYKAKEYRGYASSGLNNRTCGPDSTLLYHLKLQLNGDGFLGHKWIKQCGDCRTWLCARIKPFEWWITDAGYAVRSLVQAFNKATEDHPVLLSLDSAYHL